MNASKVIAGEVLHFLGSFTPNILELVFRMPRLDLISQEGTLLLER